MVTNLWIQNGEEEEDEEVGWDAGFTHANGGPVSFGPLLFFLFFFFFLKF